MTSKQTDYEHTSTSTLYLINEFRRTLTPSDVIMNVPFSHVFYANTSEPRIQCRNNDFHSVAHYSSLLNTYYPADVAALFKSRKKLADLLMFVYYSKEKLFDSRLVANNLPLHLLENLAIKRFQFNLDTNDEANNFHYVDMHTNEKTCYGFDFLCKRLSFIENNEFNIQLSDDLIYTSQLFEVFILIVNRYHLFKNDYSDKLFVTELFKQIQDFLESFIQNLDQFNKQSKD